MDFNVNIRDVGYLIWDCQMGQGSQVENWWLKRSVVQLLSKQRDHSTASFWSNKPAWWSILNSNEKNSWSFWIRIEQMAPRRSVATLIAISPVISSVSWYLVLYLQNPWASCSPEVMPGSETSSLLKRDWAEMKSRTCLRTSGPGRSWPCITTCISKTSRWWQCKPKLRSENLKDRAVSSFLTSSQLLWLSPFTLSRCHWWINLPSFSYLYLIQEPFSDLNSRLGGILLFVSTLSQVLTSVLKGNCLLTLSSSWALV